MKASPANKRAVLETVESLKREGHECVEFQVPSGKYATLCLENRFSLIVAWHYKAAEAFNIFIALNSADGFKTLLSHLGPDPHVSFRPFSFINWLERAKQDRSLTGAVYGPMLNGTHVF